MTEWNLGGPICPLCKQQGGMGHVCTNIPPSSHLETASQLGQFIAELSAKNQALKAENEELRQANSDLNAYTVPSEVFIAAENKVTELTIEVHRLSQMTPKLAQWERAQIREEGARSAFELAENYWNKQHGGIYGLVEQWMTEWRKSRGAK